MQGWTPAGSPHPRSCGSGSVQLREVSLPWGHSVPLSTRGAAALGRILAWWREGEASVEERKPLGKSQVRREAKSRSTFEGETRTGMEGNSQRSFRQVKKCLPLPCLLALEGSPAHGFHRNVPLMVSLPSPFVREDRGPGWLTVPGTAQPEQTGTPGHVQQVGVSTKGLSSDGGVSPAWVPPSDAVGPACRGGLRGQ